MPGKTVLPKVKISYAEIGAVVSREKLSTPQE
jgi:hypothetical protein